MTLYKVKAVHTIEEEFLVSWKEDSVPTAQELTELLPKSGSRILAQSDRFVTGYEPQPQSVSD